MDSVDRNILKCLRDNARLSATELGKKVSLSVAAVIERIRKMEAGGIIEQYTVILNQQKLGNDVSALMEVSLEHPKYYDDFIEKIKSLEEIEDCYYVTGDYDFMLKISTCSSKTLEYLHRTVKGINGVSGTKTFFVLKEVKKTLAPIPEKRDV
ncbi:MAG: Lrp/AsnC family transcriptional regulator [Lachnospiraceae bacterium]